MSGDSPTIIIINIARTCSFLLLAFSRTAEENNSQDVKIVLSFSLSSWLRATDFGGLTMVSLVKGLNYDLLQLYKK